MKSLTIAIAQMNMTVGDLAGNRQKIARGITQARGQGADIVAFPELAVTGYPPEDLLLKSSFLKGARQAVKELVPLTKGIIAVVGFPDRDSRGNLYNAAGILADGKLAAVYHKMALPNYGVFDEKRYFAPGKNPLVIEVSSVKVGISICEDVWVAQGPCRAQARAGAKLLLNISASPYHAGKISKREKLLCRRAKEFKSWFCYVNLVGGQDELIFDGGSLVVSPAGKVVFKAPQFQEGLHLVRIPPAGAGRVAPAMKSGEEILNALVLGTRDYCVKNHFSRVVLGLSGGIDSALTAAVAAAALGREKVTGVSMPSRYSSTATRQDARRLAKNLGIAFHEISIEPVFRAALRSLAPLFKGRKADVTEENLQARIRGMLLMALSNKFGWLVLATGNKSEMSTGYCTLYGDMVGGFAVIKDLPKTSVYRVSRYANRYFGREVIPPSIFERPPMAELKRNQRDQDTLPPYELLDRIVKGYVEEDRPFSQLRRRVSLGERQIRRVLRMIDASEYKRRQAPVGIKITPRAFGKDRRMPITNKFQEV